MQSVLIVPATEGEAIGYGLTLIFLDKTVWRPWCRIR